MAENLVLSVLILLCCGQIFACARGELAAAIYYVLVACLDYFSVWHLAVWDPYTLCGIIFVAWPILTPRGRHRGPAFARHPVLLFVVYVVAVTVLGSLFWPYDSMMGRSPVYSYLRGPVQLLELALLICASWRVAIALRTPGAFPKARAAWLWMALPLCLYAVYQWQATKWSLPATGIRRPASGVTAETTGEQFAAYTLDGEWVFRACSFLGEPKGLGLGCLFWLYLAVSEFIGGESRRLAGAVLGLAGAALWLTASTSAWAGVPLMAGLSCLVGFRDNRMGRHIAVVLLVGGAVAGILPFLSEGFVANLGRIWDLRFAERLENPLGDTPEVMAREVLSGNPHFALTGTGLGGISFYIAERLGGSDTILFPNSGLLGMLCDYGLFGLALLFLAVRSGLARLLVTDPERGRESELLAFVGAGMLLQALIFPAPWQIAVALGCLVGAELRWKYARVASYSRNFACGLRGIA